MNPSRPQPVRIGFSDLLGALREARTPLLHSPFLGMSFAAVFSLIGAALLGTALRLGLAPMTWALAGGFLLVGPVILSGFFAISAAQRAGRRPGWKDIVRGMAGVPRGLLGLSLVCILLFLIWMTDAGILYSFMIGDTAASWISVLPYSALLLRFQLGAFTMGAFFAFIVFCISAYAVPLLIEGRASLVTGISASVRAVFMSFPVQLSWAVLLAVVMLISAMVTPLLIVTLPFMAFASEALYRRVFPPSRLSPGNQDVPES